MRILELCLSPDFGGLEMAMRDFSAWLTQQTDVELCLGIAGRTRLAESLTTLEVPTLPFPPRRSKLPIGPAWRLARWIERESIDLVHLHWKFDLPMVALAKRLCRRRFAVVHTRHMNLPGKKHDPYHAWLYRSLDHLIVVTRYLHDQATRHLPIDPARITMIHSGTAPSHEVDPARVQERRAAIGMAAGFHVGLFGRISHYKGQHLLIEAIEILHRQGKCVDGWIIGEAFEPGYLDSLRQDVADRGLTDSVHFVGFQQQPQELMPAFDVITLTTRNETFGLVLVEAMQAGVAVVGSREGGVPEIIDDGETGLLFETWNANELATALARLHDSPPLRQRLAAAGQAKADRCFNRETQYGKVLELLKDSAPSRTLSRTIRASTDNELQSVA